jgi:O-acetyl-ADP-ribose deacetylase (regulator of RNase III)
MSSSLAYLPQFYAHCGRPPILGAAAGKDVKEQTGAPPREGCQSRKTAVIIAAMSEADKTAATAITEQIHRIADTALKLPEAQRDSYLAAAARAARDSLLEQGLPAATADQFATQLEQLARNLITMIILRGGAQGGSA